MPNTNPTHPKTKREEWEKEFDEMVYKYNRATDNRTSDGDMIIGGITMAWQKKAKSFISQVRTQAIEEEMGRIGKLLKEKYTQGYNEVEIDYEDLDKLLTPPK
jgi:hypothetical protein